MGSEGFCEETGVGVVFCGIISARVGLVGGVGATAGKDDGGFTLDVTAGGALGDCEGGVGLAG